MFHADLSDVNTKMCYLDGFKKTVLKPVLA